MAEPKEILNDFVNTGDLVTFAEYFLQYDYCKDKSQLDEWLVKSILVITQRHHMDILYNFILQLYRDDYDLSHFELSSIYPVNVSNLKSVTNCYTKRFSGGIGDFLRGSVHLFENLCHHTQASVTLDFKQHPIGKFILTTAPETQSEPIDLEVEAESNRGSQNWSMHMKKILNETISSSKDLAISSFYHDVLIVPHYDRNARCFLQNYNLTDKCKRYFKFHIYFHKDVENLYQTLNIKDYHVLHFRLGDRKSVSHLDEQISDLPEYIKENPNYKSFDHDYSEYYKMAKKYLKDSKCKNLIIMSDCNDLKAYFKKINKSKKIHIIHEKSTHTSYAPSTLTFTDFQNQDIEDEKLLHTALDVKILSESKSNISYSVYDWGSGFVYWISKIFDVPCEINTLWK